MKEYTQITSKENPLIKLISDIQTSARARRKNNLFALEGVRICKDALENGIGFDKLIFTDSALQKYGDDLEKFSENSDKCIKISDNLFLKISDTDSPQGVISLAKIPENKNIVQNGRFIAFENLQDPSNLGAAARTAEALGISAIVLTGGCDPYSPKALRSSMGTLLRMPIIITDDIIEFARINNLRTFACVPQRDAENISDVDFADGDMLIIGNEGNGLSETVKNSSFKRITIPMKGTAESLNAAAAAAIAMWEIMNY